MKIKIVVWILKAILYVPTKVFVGLCWFTSEVLLGLATTIYIVSNYMRG